MDATFLSAIELNQEFFVGFLEEFEKETNNGRYKVFRGTFKK